MIDLSTSTNPDLTVAAQVLAVFDTSARVVGAEYMVGRAGTRNPRRVDAMADGIRGT